MSCRTGPLRVGRPLRGGCTGRGGISDIGPPVGRDYYFPTNGRTTNDRSCKKDIQATKWPPHAQWARPAGHSSFGVFFPSATKSSSFITAR